MCMNHRKNTIDGCSLTSHMVCVFMDRSPHFDTNIDTSVDPRLIITDKFEEMARRAESSMQTCSKLDLFQRHQTQHAAG